MENYKYSNKLGLSNEYLNNIYDSVVAENDMCEPSSFNKLMRTV